MRTALLSAVSHDLRTPRASARTAVDSLANPSTHWSDEERAELVATAQDSLERLNRLVANLLDMSRLQARDRHKYPARRGRGSRPPCPG